MGVKFGRITALDAAGPEFENCTAEVRIDQSDAEFVDTIHTSALGIRKPYGHADFYPNGGIVQNGCAPLDFNCNHMRATELFIDSLNDKNCEFRSCDSWEDYEKGDCAGNQTNVMGYYAQIPANESRYFGATSSQKPFCT